MALEYLAASIEETWTVNSRRCGFAPGHLNEIGLYWIGGLSPWRFNTTAILPTDLDLGGAVTVKQELWVTLPYPHLGAIAYPDAYRLLSAPHCRDDSGGGALNGFTFFEAVNRISVSSSLGAWSIDFYGGAVLGTTASAGYVGSTGTNPTTHVSFACDVTYEQRASVLGEAVPFGSRSLSNTGSTLGGAPWGIATLLTSDGEATIRIVGPASPIGGAQAAISAGWQEAWGYHLRARLVDLDGGDVHKRVIVQKAYPGTNVPGVVPNESIFYEAATTPIDITVSRPRTLHQLSYQCGGGTLQNPSPPRVQEVLDPFQPDPRFVGIRIPRSTLQDTAPPYSSLIEEWHQGCDVTTYRLAGNNWLQVAMPFDFVFTPSPDLALTDYAIGRVSLPSAASLNTSSWQAVGTGATAVGSVLKAGPAGGVFTTTGTLGVIRPHRWLQIEYESSAGTSADLEVIGGAAFRKRYALKLEAGRHTGWIDLADPQRVTIGGVGYSGSSLELIDGGLGLPGYEDSSTAIGRFDGVDGATAIALSFASSTVQVLSIRPAVKTRARLRQGSSYMPLSASDNGFGPSANYYGDVDGLVMFRVQHDAQNTFGMWQGLGLSGSDISGGRLNTSPYILWLDKNLSRYPEIDLQAGGVIYGSRNDVMTGLTPGLDQLGAITTPVQLTGQMVWGFRAAATAVPAVSTPIDVETVGGTRLAEFTTDAATGLGAAQVHFYPDNVRPFLWHSEEPSSFARIGNQVYYRHLWMYPRKHQKKPKWRFPNTLNWGCVVWAGLVKPSSVSSISVAEGRQSFRSREATTGYWVAWVDPDGGNLLISRAWRSEGLFEYLGVIDDAPDCEEPRLAYNPMNQAITCVYARAAGIYRRYSLDWGESWLGGLYMAGIKHAREKYNPRLKERVFLYVDAAGALRGDIYNESEQKIASFDVAGQIVDDSSFDAEFVTSIGALDVVFIADGKRRRYRSLDDGRSWFAAPLS